MSALITQTVMEVVVGTNANARMTQTAIETVTTATPIARTTQTSMEVVIQYRRGRYFAAVIG